MQTWTIQKILLWASDFFQQKGIATARLDAELLLAAVLNYSRVQLYTNYDQPLGAEELQRFKDFIKRRAAREPLAYILGEKEFYGLAFSVGPGVLVPRPETEQIVELGLAYFEENHLENPKVMDLATGSGCILVALAKLKPQLHGIGVDISPAALKIAESNHQKLAVDSSLQWVLQDLSQDWSAEMQGPFDLITANLPYVSAADYDDLEPELKNYEPKAALVPGVGGLESFDWILSKLDSRLNAGSMALLEIGCDQKNALEDLISRDCPELKPRFYSDLSGLPRILELKKSR